MLRLFRLFRLSRILKKWDAFLAVTQMLQRSLSAAWPIIVILCIFWFIYTIVAMQIFGAQMEIKGYFRFDNFYWAFVNTFMIFTTENWNSLYFMTKQVSSVAPAFFVSFTILGQYILYNLVVVRRLSVRRSCHYVLG